jgi:hypothetical protein
MFQLCYRVFEAFGLACAERSRTSFVFLNRFRQRFLYLNGVPGWIRDSFNIIMHDYIFVSFGEQERNQN